MSKFQFRLATLVKLREATRDEKRAALAEALRAIALLDERMRMVQQELAGLKQACKAAAKPGTVQVDRLLEAQRYEIVLLTELKRLQQQMTTIQAEADRRREALVVADREVKTLEKLREKQAARWVLAAEHLEQKQLDEVASHRIPEVA